VRLADFIESEAESILEAWEDFARAQTPAACNMDDEELRNDAAKMLRIISSDLRTDQSEAERLEKSHGDEPGEHNDAGHGSARFASKFTIEQLVAEYRALRSSVLHLWAKRLPLSSVVDIRDIIRFDEALDQLLAASVFSFASAKSDSENREQKNRNEFLAMLGHELRNPLAPISSAAKVLKLKKRDAHLVENVSDVISRQVAHMMSLVDDLLDMSRVKRGIIEIKLEVIDLRLAIRDAIEQVTPQIDARHQELSVELPEKPAAVQADKKRIVQIITNLLANAAKYTHDGGHLRLTVTQRDEEVIVAVEDDGQGMSPDFVPRAFDLFTQASRTPDRHEGGLGLGLALVKNLVEMHGGRVDCRSDGLGKGSTFVVRLPRLPGSVE